MEKGLKTKLCSKKRENERRRRRWWWQRWGVQVTSGLGGLVEREKWYEHRAHTFISFKLYLRALFDFLNSCVLYYVGIITWKIFDMIVKTSETNCVWKGDFSAILFLLHLLLSFCAFVCIGMAWHGLATYYTVWYDMVCTAWVRFELIRSIGWCIQIHMQSYTYSCTCRQHSFLFEFDPVFEFHPTHTHPHTHI